MNARYTAVVILGCSIFGAAAGAALQGPSSTKASDSAAAPKTSQAKPMNLRVLPKETTQDKVNRLMGQYVQYLGVPCGYCHEENPQTGKIDYVSDENPRKGTARFMIAMTADINNKYLAQLGDRRYAEPLTCGNCHQGQSKPPVFEPKAQ